MARIRGPIRSSIKRLYNYPYPPVLARESSPFNHVIPLSYMEKVWILCYSETRPDGEAVMSVAEKICKHIQDLPESLQTEVLDFVGYLEAKATRQGGVHDHIISSEISLALAMRGMEDEALPEYSRVDLKGEF
jgi:hypothetical protein